MSGDPSVGRIADRPGNRCEQQARSPWPWEAPSNLDHRLRADPSPACRGDDHRVGFTRRPCHAQACTLGPTDLALQRGKPETPGTVAIRHEADRAAAECAVTIKQDDRGGHHAPEAYTGSVVGDATRRALASSECSGSAARTPRGKQHAQIASTDRPVTIEVGTALRRPEQPDALRRIGRTLGNRSRGADQRAAEELRIGLDARRDGRHRRPPAVRREGARRARPQRRRKRLP